MADQPTLMSGTAPNTGTTVNGNYVYDGNLKRVKSIVNGITRYNVYDHKGRLTHVEEGDGNYVSETNYLHGAGMTLARIKDGVFTYMHPDHLGSPQVGTMDDGTVAWNEYYTPFGEALISHAANDNQSGFTGHIKDADTGLNYMQARYYDPNIGRFLSVDPVGFMGPSMFNRYAYAANNPINRIDPDGMRSFRLREAQLDRETRAERGKAIKEAQQNEERGTQCAGECTPTGNYSLGPNGRPFSEDFNDKYLRYGINDASDVTRKIGGTQIDELGASGTCAIRITCALNALGIDVSSGSRLFDGPNKGARLVPGSGTLIASLTEMWGSPITSDIDTVRGNLSENQVAIIVAPGHAGVVTKDYNDPYTYSGSVWVLPLKGKE